MKKGDEPAFPLSGEGLKLRDEGHWSDCFGMSKREYIATQIAVGLLAAAGKDADRRFAGTHNIIEKAIEYADDLLTELEK